MKHMKKGILILTVVLLLVAAIAAVQAVSPYTPNPGPDDHYKRYLNQSVTVSTLNNGLVQGIMTVNYVQDFEVLGKCGQYFNKTVYVTKSSVVFIAPGYTCGG
jgi:hypothetical protein